ncbi:hypothetical protein DPMN_041101 [Dreissena polymorpha]|uniref:Uncharacterized protein n=1 Tax=Dreissena polymorpha TaxID=45954 RepID=A0A9D4CYS1_DREPO|nr:hypothetical protein DPMN_041101 [Dreissena polymorpha]
MNSETGPPTGDKMFYNFLRALLCCLRFDRDYLNILGEVIGHHQDVPVTSGCHWEWANKVNC